MRAIEIQCDGCGKARPLRERPRTWWELEQMSAVQTTGVLDFCSLPCLLNWLDSPEVRNHPAYRADFHPQEATDGGL